MAMRAMQEATFMILTALANGSQHGYGIIADVREISGGRVRLRAGTLYTALDRLRADELIGVDREEVVDGRLRRYYRLTPAGTRRLARRGGPAAGSCRRRADAAEPGRGDGDMTDQEHLERGYRRLLAWYPREFRRENGQEILAVLMACAPDGQRRPGLAEAADLIRSGLWLRLRPSVPRSARTVRAAVRLMYAGAAVSTVNLVILLALIGDIKAHHAVLGHHLTAAQVSQLNTLFITTWHTLVPGPDRPVAVDGAGDRPGPELGAHRVHGAVRRGDARPDRRLQLAAGDPVEPRPGGVRPDRPRGDLAGRPRRGVAAVASGLQSVLQAAGLHAGPAPGADDRTRHQRRWPNSPGFDRPGHSSSVRREPRGGLSDTNGETRQLLALAERVGRRPVGNIRKIPAGGYRLRFRRYGEMRTSPEIYAHTVRSRTRPMEDGRRRPGRLQS